MTADLHLAQLNIARMQAPLEDPVMAGFVAKLDEINALADASEGFVWRLQGEDGDATAIRAFDDPNLLVNMSVWTSVECLQRYVYASAHLDLIKARDRWFEKLKDPSLALWWIPTGHIPDLEEAKARLQRLADQGPGPEAFTFARPFSAHPGSRP
jgi:hypothetical protein